MIPQRSLKSFQSIRAYRSRFDTTHHNNFAVLRRSTILSAMQMEFRGSVRNVWLDNSFSCFQIKWRHPTFVKLLVAWFYLWLYLQQAFFIIQSKLLEILMAHFWQFCTARPFLMFDNIIERFSTKNIWNLCYHILNDAFYQQQHPCSIWYDGETQNRTNVNMQRAHTCFVA